MIAKSSHPITDGAEAAAGLFIIEEAGRFIATLGRALTLVNAPKSLDCAHTNAPRGLECESTPVSAPRNLDCAPTGAPRTLDCAHRAGLQPKWRRKVTLAKLASGEVVRPAKAERHKHEHMYRYKH